MKTFSWVLGIIVIIVLGAVIFVYNQPRSVPPQSYTNTNPSPAPKVLPSLSFVTLLPNSTCPQLTASLTNPPNITNITKFFEPCAIPANIDTNSFAILGDIGFGIWAKDKNGVYFYQNARGDATQARILKIQGADQNTFTAIDSKSSIFYKDANYVYYFTPQNGLFGVTTTPNVDAATFSSIGSGYFKDKNKVYYFDAYWNWGVVDGADPATFQFIGPGMNKIGIAKDKNCIYRGTYKILDSSNKCVSPTNCTSQSLASNPASCGIEIADTP